MEKEPGYIEELLPRYCEGKTTIEENERVRAWMDESEENRKIVQQIHSLYLATDTLQVLKKIDTEKALYKVRQQMNKKTIHWWKWMQHTAAILFIPLVLAYAYQYISRPAEHLQMLEVRTNPGTTTFVTLPDGTNVFLNSESTLTYPAQFKKDKREVRLEGEGYFEVKSKPRHPFIVTTPQNCSIEVLGTTFNAEAYADEQFISTTLIEGKVRFNYVESGILKNVILTPGRKVVYNRETTQIDLLYTSGQPEISWKDNKVILNNTSMQDALRMLEKTYNVKFIVNNKEVMDNFFTGTFTHQNLDRILEYFRLSSNIQWKYTEPTGKMEKKTEIEIFIKK